MTSSDRSTDRPFTKLGDIQLDQEHDTFAQLLHRLTQADNAQFKSLLTELLAHTERHFEHESRLMADCQFPAVGEHDDEHRRVLGQMRQFKERVDRGSLAMAREWVKQTLPDWLRLHTSTMDAALVAHIAKVSSRHPVRPDDSLPVAPSVSSASPQANPHFDALGGTPTIERLVERFYYYMDTLPEATTIRAMHGPDLGPIRSVLVRYLSEWTGGPPLYSVERGHPRLRKRHLAFKIGPRERDAWMTCMRRAMSDVITDVTLRAELDAAFYKVADFIRNDADHVHVKH